MSIPSLSSVAFDDGKGWKYKKWWGSPADALPVMLLGMYAAAVLLLSALAWRLGALLAPLTFKEGLATLWPASVRRRLPDPMNRCSSAAEVRGRLPWCLVGSA